MLEQCQTTHTNTPTLMVIEPRGLIARSVRYYRAGVIDPADTRADRTVHDPLGRAIGLWDPRLFYDASPTPNLCSVHSLSGAVLCSVSVDAGLRVSLFGEAGQPVQSWDGRGSQRRMRYDEQLRLSEVHEQVAGGEAVCAERLTYAANDQAFADHNQCGQLIRHADPAGVLLFNDYALNGAVLEQERHLYCEETDGYITHSRFNPTGELRSQTDARRNEQQFHQSLDGALRAVDLRLNDTLESLPIVRAITYNAHGQVEQEVAGNGVITTLEYDPKDGRLRRLLSRLANNAALQDMRYTYDPVGNVLSIEDAALPIRFFANQRIEPISHFRYDTLYRLVEATGWEAGAVKYGPLSAQTADPAMPVNYRQTYRYDAGHNLLELTHVGAQDPGHRLVAEAHSNRCLPVRRGVEPGEDDFRNGFDANGNLLKLHPGLALSWDVRNQLREVRPIERNGADDDIERYEYAADGMRVRKVRSLHTVTQTNLIETRYLPGLEICTHSGTGEELHVIEVSTGRGSVRVLHWIKAKPKDLPNNQQRYSLTDHLGSSTLELDQHANVITQERYYPFGGTAWSSGEAVQVSYKTVRYSGKERDASGLYYYGLRYYGPRLQRWLNPDPLTAIDGLNLYAFVTNDPVNFKDQKGLYKWPRRPGSSSPTVAGLIEIFNRPSGGQSRIFLNDEREVIGRRIETLALQSQDSPSLMEYSEGGNGMSDQINFYLRGLPTTEENIKAIVENFRKEVRSLPDYRGEAYRAVRVNADVFGDTIKTGQIVADKAFMSASVNPHGVIGWLETWADHKPDVSADQQRVILVFDAQAPKKVAATGFLADHLLIEPLTQFQVKEIHHLEAGESSSDVTVVGLQYAANTSHHKIRDLRTGDILLPAINPGLVSRLRSFFCGQ